MCSDGLSKSHGTLFLQSSGFALVVYYSSAPSALGTSRGGLGEECSLPRLLVPIAALVVPLYHGSVDLLDDGSHLVSVLFCFYTFVHVFVSYGFVNLFILLRVFVRVCCSSCRESALGTLRFIYFGSSSCLSSHPVPGTNRGSTTVER